MDLNNRKDLVYLVLAGLFVSNAILGEVLGGKLIQVGGYVMSMGVVPWPVVFLSTDLINEYYGRDGVRKLTFITVALIAYAFLVIFAAMAIPAWDKSPVTDAAFTQVFGQSLWIIVGSLIAFVASQLVDVFVFWLFRSKTGGKMLWLRATGSTAVSQLIDTFVILGIAFYLPGKITGADFWNFARTNYTYKFAIAVALTPLIYAVHAAIDKYLGEHHAHQLARTAAAARGAAPFPPG